jgi:hypothetical protein
LTKAGPCVFSDADYRGSVIVVLRNDNSHPVELFQGRSYVQLVPTAYFADAIGEFYCGRRILSNPWPSSPMAPLSPPNGAKAPNSEELGETEDELLKFLHEQEQNNERGTRGFGSSDRE